ncbi:hypothetical protein BC936DRAFT_149762 [Jimgerdemannia flammicorona]|uniref:Zf-CHY-domain-containing protein n=1 Tax=Jimgerdemannia flammicorona TaxID=994334 RepID=A0A433DJR2_9FUNG|nr:hypothetical protein BC936DRAFT_149762 [Jimgerdemannia flammicorona]
MSADPQPPTTTANTTATASTRPEPDFGPDDDEWWDIDDEDGDEDVDDEDDEEGEEEEDVAEEVDQNGTAPVGPPVEASNGPLGVERRTTTPLKPAAKVVPKVDEVDLRKKILAIQQEVGLDAKDRARRIQELMTSGYSGRKLGSSSSSKNGKERFEPDADMNELTEEDLRITYNVRFRYWLTMTVIVFQFTLVSLVQKHLQTTFNHQNEARGIMGCSHYQRGTKLKANCCGKWFSCRFCHDDISDHSIIRHETKTMMCTHCKTVQPAAQICCNSLCKKQLARYYCDKCKLWDDDASKNIYHCDQCGICRIGKGLGQDYFHCTKCNVCMNMSLKDKHRCIERNLECDCPICGEYMFTSTTVVIFMRCGHCIHQTCHNQYIETSYQCPTCLKSLWPMNTYFDRIDRVMEQQRMPPEYDDFVSHILCNDCEKKSHAKYHFLYHKCQHCMSYNTTVLQTIQESSGQSVANLAAATAASNANSAGPVPGLLAGQVGRTGVTASLPTTAGPSSTAQASPAALATATTFTPPPVQPAAAESTFTPQENIVLQNFFQAMTERQARGEGSAAPQAVTTEALPSPSSSASGLTSPTALVDFFQSLMARSANGDAQGGGEQEPRE